MGPVTVTVVGGGLVGSLVSCFLAKKGFNVDLYEMREDIRLMETVKGKSINLAISERGRSALRVLGLEGQLLADYAIPMRARLIHGRDGQKRSIPYGNKDQCIYSVGRRHLNEILITEAEKHPNVNIHFNHKLKACDLNERNLTFSYGEKDNHIKEQPFDVVIGADGAYSALRRSFLKLNRFDFSQTYIDHGYIELSIPPKIINGQEEYAMEVQYLHIWPRGTFMMIALPNLDKSYTVTLFMPFHKFETIRTPKELINFFTENFKDAIPLIGETKLIQDYFSVFPNPLVSIKCKPYNYDDKALLIGDAAHAMVPFYGQGMNCGFEDCLVIYELLNECKNDIRSVLPKFNLRRNADCHVICELAMYNYIEMRDLVNSPLFILRKKFDGLMNKLFPKNWIPLYGMVTFSRIPYSKCLENRKIQDQFITIPFKISCGLVTAAITYIALVNDYIGNWW